MLELLSNFEKAKSWLINSGIVISDFSDENSGSVHSFYDEKKNEFSFIYPEITGYFLSTLRFLYNLEKNNDYLKNGQQTSDWLIKLNQDNGGIIQGIYNSQIQNLSYSFDTAICAKGLLDYFLISNEKKYLESAKTLTLQIEHFLESDGMLKPLKNLSTDKFEENSKIWYKQKGCLHIKNCIPFFQLYKITNDVTFLKKGILICDTFSKYQNDDGSINLHINDNTINLHTLCYALEGLFYAYYVTKNKKYLESVKNALIWVIKNIQDDGSVNLWFNTKYHEKAAYPIAQLIRLLILLDKIEENDFLKYAKKLSIFLFSLQGDSKNISINGGFYEGFTKTIFGWKRIPKINSWTTMFAIQAIYWLNHHNEYDFDSMIEYIF
jgi:rhamnogalacturonyl hydrolase YesR